MKLPLFYQPDLEQGLGIVTLDEATSKHVIQVLRMQLGERLQLTNGRGGLWNMEIADDNRKKCKVKVLSGTQAAAPQRKVSIAISPVKNNTRFEWFLEKATEIGVSAIIPLICERTEKQHFKYDRMNNILISAMLQSQQCWLPVLTEPTKFNLLTSSATHQQKFIAHCLSEGKRDLTDLVNGSLDSHLILIGPEGDFTTEEIELALQNNFSAVSLGKTRLRTETAGIVAAVLLNDC